jgi:uncharacterized phage infection (PIP) family protein YhgE
MFYFAIDNILFFKKFDLIGTIELFMFMVIFGFIFSIPTMLIVSISENYLLRANLKSHLAISILILASLFGILGTFELLDASLFTTAKSSILPLSYSITMTLSLIYFAGKKKRISIN